MGNQAYRQWKKKIIRSAKEKKIPILGQYELTPACNLDCKMCYVHNADSNKLRNLELPTEQWKRIFDQAYDCGLMFANLTGGECLMRKDFKELYLHLWNKRVMITVLTNATLITEDYVAFFKEYKPEQIQITLYGSSEDGYRNVTGHEGFTRAIWAIEALRDAGIDVTVTVTPSKYNRDDYIKTLQLIKDKGFKTQFADMYLTEKRDNEQDCDHYLTEEEIIRLSKERMLLYQELTPLTDLPEIGGPMTGEPRTGLPCNAGSCLACVRWDGKMYPCGSVLLGDASLLEMDYAAAWEVTKAATDTAIQGLLCDGCAYEKACPVCLAVRLKDLHSGECNPAVCRITKRQVAEGAIELDALQSDNIEHSV